MAKRYGGSIPRRPQKIEGASAVPNLNLRNSAARYNAFVDPAGGTRCKWSPCRRGWTVRSAIVATIGVDSDLLIRHLQKLVANGVRKLLLNLAGVTQLDSSSISAIIGTYVSLIRQGGSLKLLRPCGRVRAVLRVIRVLGIIPTFEDETQALASFRPQGYSARP